VRSGAAENRPQDDWRVAQGQRDYLPPVIQEGVSFADAMRACNQSAQDHAGHHCRSGLEGLIIGQDPAQFDGNGHARDA